MSGCTVAASGVISETVFASPRPAAVPNAPPIAETAAASIRNCVMIVRRFAPSARRIPISRVRSRTETSMMFMIPMPPTRSVISPTPIATPKSAPVSSAKVFASWSGRLIVKSSSFSGASPPRAPHDRGDLLLRVEDLGRRP